MLKINGIEYILDTNAIMDFVSTPININFNKDVKNNTEITELHSRNALNEFNCVSKEIRELKLNSLQIDSIKYDYIKLLLTTLFDTNIDTMKIDNLSMQDGIYFGNILTINTLMNLKILIIK